MHTDIDFTDMLRKPVHVCTTTSLTVEIGVVLFDAFLSLQGRDKIDSLRLSLIGTWFTPRPTECM